MRKIFAAALLPLLASTTAYAATINPTVTKSDGITYNTKSISDYSTNRGDMAGSIVTVLFGDGTSNKATWTALGAANTGWALSLGTLFSSDTYTSTWTFSNLGQKAISGFTFNGVPGDTTFDITSSPTQSPGSSYGKAITDVTGPAGLAVAALYTNRLLVNNVFYGDLYTQLNISFTNTGGLASNRSMSFVTDTDNAATRGGITPAVPEPATWAMMMIGFGAVGFAMRRRVRASEVKFTDRVARIAAGELA